MTVAGVTVARGGSGWPPLLRAWGQADSKSLGERREQREVGMCITVEVSVNLSLPVTGLPQSHTSSWLQ